MTVNDYYWDYYHELRLHTQALNEMTKLLKEILKKLDKMDNNRGIFRR